MNIQDWFPLGLISLRIGWEQQTQIRYVDLIIDSATTQLKVCNIVLFLIENVFCFELNMTLLLINLALHFKFVLPSISNSLFSDWMTYLIDNKN